MTTSLSSIGWNPNLSSSFTPLAERGLSPARVSGEFRGQVDLMTGHNTVRAWVRGTLQHGLTAPGIGDWVGVRLSEDPTMPAMVEAVLPRRTQFVRQSSGRTSEPQLIAANIDTVMVTTSLNSDLNIRRIERYLAVILSGGAVPVVVLTKADLTPDPQTFVDRIPAEHVVVLSALHGTGLQSLEPWLRPASTTALVGSSGVGKSTLINALIGEQVQDTGGIRERDERGRHTTSTRTLIPLPGRGCLIDTPGMREMGLWEGSDVLQSVYDDIATLATSCAFRDCNHNNEPGCAVTAAIDRGELDAGRLTGFNKLQRELLREARRTQKHEVRAANKKRGKYYKRVQKERRAFTGKE